MTLLETHLIWSSLPSNCSPPYIVSSLYGELRKLKRLNMIIKLLFNPLLLKMSFWKANMENAKLWVYFMKFWANNKNILINYNLWLMIPTKLPFNKLLNQSLKIISKNCVMSIFTLVSDLSVKSSMKNWWELNKLMSYSNILCTNPSKDQSLISMLLMNKMMKKLLLVWDINCTLKYQVLNSESLSVDSVKEAHTLII
jgi:hypothetical protein